MSERWIRALAALSLCGALVLAAGCAGLKSAERDRGDKPRVVVLAVEGKRSAAVRNKIVALLEDRYEVVPRRRYERAARRLGARSLRAADVAQVAAELDLAAVVHGYLERGAERRYELAVIVREGESGAVVDELGVTLRTRRLAGKARRRLRKRLYAAVTELASGSRRDRDGDRELDVGPRESRLDALAEVNDREGEEHRERRAAELERERREDERAERRRRERAEREARDEERAERRRAAREREELERERREDERAERERREDERAERERREDERAERAARQRDRDDADDEIEEEVTEPPPRIQRDDSGQAIDDEMPDILR